jgi:HD-GYP domain-containing protein (c-di-GMP phosphodiesterase class II)
LASLGSKVGPPLKVEEDHEDVLLRLERLNEVGSLLSQERRLPALLEKILDAATTITRADGGTLYLVEGEGEDRRLHFEIVRTVSLDIAMGGTSGAAVPFYPIPLMKNGEPNASMVAAYAVLRGHTINIQDAYAEAGFDFSGTRAFDLKTGYRSRSFLTVPMKDQSGEVIGVLQLINRTDPATGRISEFSDADRRLAESLASQAAVALTNHQLIDQLQKLFESFIGLINTAIDEKSPYTGGHCQRVPTLTMMLADAVERTREGPLGSFRMSAEDRYELHIAGLLHDCGKITTPVHVVDKSTKLEGIYDRITLVDTRFEILKRDAEILALKKKLELKQERLDAVACKAREYQIENELRETLRQIEDDRNFLRRCNSGSESMPEEDRDRVQRIAKRYQWRDVAGNTADFLSGEEAENLRIKRGTLNAAEREIVNYHIVSTINMLEALPWPKHLRNVPEFAGGHHERMDGRGYPRGLTRDEMSVQARIMGIADIFEALTAKDRPYKRGNTLSESLYILGNFRLNGHIDPDLFDIFVREKVYLRYAEQFLDAAQIDDVDETKIPGYQP